jgi:hypothetical protein
VLELIERYAADDRPPMNSQHHHLADTDQATWFWYFAATKTTGLTWSTGPFAPTFQTHGVIQSDRLVHGSEHVAPDMARIHTGVIDSRGPALTFTPTHPYATAVEIRPADGRADSTQIVLGAAFPVDGDPGTHSFEVATVTPFTTLTGAPLRYIKR